MEIISLEGNEISTVIITSGDGEIGDGTDIFGQMEI